LYSKANWDNVNSYVKAIYNEIMNMKNIGESVNSMWTYFQNNLDNRIKNNIPHKTAKNKDGYPWINRDLKRLIRKRDRSYKRKKKSGNKAVKNKYNKLKHETQRQLRKAYWKYVEGIVTPEVDDRAGNRNYMKRFWTYIKHKRSDSNTIPLLKADGILHPDSKDKANILNKQFQMAFSTKTELSDESFKNTCNMKGKFETMHDIHITEEGITKLLKKLNPHKAPGPDNITPRV
jgi:hypothetical protein